MAQIAVRAALIATCLSLTNVAFTPVEAQSIEELDGLSDGSVDEKAGIQAARDQASRGEYLEALATLERVLAQHPKSVEGRIIHAVYLCRIDDVQGGLVEISSLKPKEFGKQLLEEAKALCEKGSAS